MTSRNFSSAAQSRSDDDERPLVSFDDDAKPVVSVVLPTLNEEEGIAQCITDIKAALAELDLPGEIVVSDNSNDRTAEIAQDRGATVVEPDKLGYGYAYRYAFRAVRGEYVVIGDADTTYDFSEIPRLLAPLQADEADLVIGSRFAGRIEKGAMKPLHRYVGNPLLTKFLDVFYDSGVSDAHSGFRAFRRDILDDLKLRSNGMEFASEMVMAAAVMDLRIQEVPIVYHPRVGDETLNSLSDGWRHVKFMLMNAPNYLFTIPGLSITALGGLGVVGSLGGVELGGTKLGSFTLTISGLLVILGYQVVTLALFTTVGSNPIKEPADRITPKIIATMSLERGIALGVALCGLGTAAVLGMDSLAPQVFGLSQPPFSWYLVALFVVIIGLQTVFYAFQLTLLGSEQESEIETVTGQPDAQELPQEAVNPE